MTDTFTTISRLQVAQSKEAFASEAQKRGVTQKELLYEYLRAGGINIPDTAEIDGRRR